MAGQQIVSAGWIKQTTAPQIARKNGGSYGYFWWSDKASVDGHDTSWIGSYGWGGQFLCVVPSLNLVVVVTAAKYGFDGPSSSENLGDDTGAGKVRVAGGVLFGEALGKAKPSSAPSFCGY